ncbi:MAG: GAF domain-containing protein [Anaerolineales bacterium]|nr:GAF domain-containing protein [Anaerolineales bacterium]
MNKLNLILERGDYPPESSSESYNYNAWRGRFILPVLRIACLLGLGLFFIVFRVVPVSSRILFLFLLLGLFGVTFLRASYNVRAITLLSVTFIAGANEILLLGAWGDATIFLLCYVTLSALLLDHKATIYALTFSFVTLIVIAALYMLNIFKPLDPGVPAIDLTRWAIFIADFAVCGLVVTLAMNALKQEFTKVTQRAQSAYQSLTEERTRLEEIIRERTSALRNRSVQLQSSTKIARALVEIKNVPDLLRASVDAITEEFNYYHVGIYLLNAQKQTATLQASSSEIGMELIGAGHRVGVGIRNPIDLVIEHNKPYAFSDLDKARFISDPNFPSTRTRIAIPLIVRGDLVGILDLHSNKLETVEEEDIEIFETVADLVAISIDNVRLIGETQALIEQLRFYNSEQTHQAWTKATSRRAPAYQYTPAGVRPIFGQVKKEESPIGVLQIPLLLQSQKIGNIHLRRKGYSTAWSEKERGMVEKIAEQISLALENSRLVEEAQRNAQRDQLIANISSRVRETLDVEAVIRTATTELRRVFDLKEAEISVGLPQAEPKAPRKHTSALRLK